jgi:predicted metal-dependent hydrolase
MLTTREYIENLVRKKSKWVKEKLAEVKSRPTMTAKKFVNGESFLYLGDLYRLRIVTEGSAPLVFRKEFILDRKHVDHARTLLVDWYRAQAARIIEERVQWHAGLAGIECGSVRITDARRRWGSCGRGNDLNFSWRVILAPLRVVDYVVVHELAHIIEKNHARAFWSKVAIMCPTYRSSMVWLRKHEHLFQM